MKAAIVTARGKPPIYTDFREPVAQSGEQLISMRAAALSQFSRSRSMGAHYSSNSDFPLVAGAEGVGVTPEGRRVYFALPRAPFGALAERCVVAAHHCVEIPDSLDDVTAAALANPGMSAWTALTERARLVKGETVLINGATGTAGRLAVQIARYLGAGRIIATGRSAAELEQVKALGAEVLIPFRLGMFGRGESAYEFALKQAIAPGINVIVDYLWGQSARTVMAAVVRNVEDATPVRFVHVGGASGQQSIDMPGAALRSSSLVLMGSGLKSVRFEALVSAVGKVFQAAEPAGLRVATTLVPLADVARVWPKPGGKPRVVFEIPRATH